MEPREYLDFLHVAEKLKDTTRHCTTSKRRTESVAEHSWRISLMAMMLRDEFPDVDTNRVTEMCLVHDLGECFTGDIPTFEKTDEDRDKEDSLLYSWIMKQPQKESKRLKELFVELNEQKTKEAQIAKALDKLEALIQHNESPLDTWSDNEFELNKTYAFNTVEEFDWLKKLRECILEDTLNKIDNEK